MEPFLFLWIFKWKRASDCILLSKTEARLHNCTLCTLHSNWIPDHTQKNHSLADLKHLFEICRFLISSALIDLDECVETICEMSMLMLNCQGLDDLLFHFGHRRKSLHCDCISAVRPQVQLIIVTSNTNDKPASRWQWMTIEDRMTIKDGNWNVLND